MVSGPLFTEEELRHWQLFEERRLQSERWASFLRTVEIQGPEYVRAAENRLNNSPQPLVPLYQTGIAIDGALWRRWREQVHDIDVSTLVERLLRLELDRHFRRKLINGGDMLCDAVWPDGTRRYGRKTRPVQVELGDGVWRHVIAHCAREKTTTRRYVERLIREDLTRLNT